MSLGGPDASGRAEIGALPALPPAGHGRPVIPAYPSERPQAGQWGFRSSCASWKVISRPL